MRCDATDASAIRPTRRDTGSAHPSGALDAGGVRLVCRLGSGSVRGSGVRHGLGWVGMSALRRPARRRADAAVSREGGREADRRRLSRKGDDEGVLRPPGEGTALRSSLAFPGPAFHCRRARGLGNSRHVARPRDAAAHSTRRLRVPTWQYRPPRSPDHHPQTLIPRRPLPSRKRTGGAICVATRTRGDPFGVSSRNRVP